MRRNSSAMRNGASWACNYRVGRLEDGTSETAADPLPAGTARWWRMRPIGDVSMMYWDRNPERRTSFLSTSDGVHLRTACGRVPDGRAMITDPLYLHRKRHPLINTTTRCGQHQLQHLPLLLLPLLMRSSLLPYAAAAAAAADREQ